MNNGQLVTRFYDDVLNAGRTEVIPELFTDDFVLHGGPGHRDGDVGQIAGAVQVLRVAFDELHVDIDDTIEQDDRVAARWTLRGRHVGAAFGIEPTGAEVTQAGMVFYRVHDGKLAEQWTLVDATALAG